MDLLILIITIIFALLNANKKKAKNRPATIAQVNKSAQDRKRQQEQQMQRERQQLKRQQERDRQVTLQDWREQQQEQRELKQRLEQKYRQKTANETGTILDRAVGNVEEKVKDVMKAKDARQHMAAGSNMQKIKAAPELTADSHALMDQVYDLMVTGYCGTMHFERDFLAEGMDMLNRIQG